MAPTNFVYTFFLCIVFSNIFPTTAHAQTIADEIIIQFEKGASQSPQNHKSLSDRINADVEIIDMVPDLDIALIKSDGEDVDMITRKLEELPEVKSAEQNQKRAFQFVPNDQLFEYQWAHRNVGQSVNGYRGTAGVDLSSEVAWDAEPTNLTDIIVAVVDAGVDYDHADLAANMWDGTACVDENNQVIPGGCPNHGWDYGDDDNDPHDSGHSDTSFTGHGTFVASQVAAVTGNNKGISGFSRRNTLKIMALKFNFDVFSEIKAIDFAKNNGAKVINASYGGGGYSQIEHDAIANFPGMFITASGNGGNDYVGDNLTSSPFYPCNYDLQNVVCVAAMNQNGDIAPFSNYSTTYVDIAAPGTNLLGIYQGSYLYGNGTSFATPLVAAAAGMIYSVDPSFSISEVRTNILSGTDQLSSLSNKIVSGRKLNYSKVLNLITSPTTSDPSQSYVHRFWSPTYRGHFFTVSEKEKNNIISSYPFDIWKYEGAAFKAHSSKSPSNLPVYRFWSSAYRGHFFTISENEKNNLITNDPSWKYEGIAYYAQKSATSNSTPLYRFWSSAYRHHFYTISKNERDNLIANDPNWKYEGVAYYLPK